MNTLGTFREQGKEPKQPPSIHLPSPIMGGGNSKQKGNRKKETVA